MKQKRTALALTMLLGLCISARANPIAITNAGFEDPILDPGAFTTGPIPGWVIGPGSGAGVWNLNSSTGFWIVGAPEGNQVGFVGRENPAGPETISQVLGDTLLGNSIYTLTGQVGHPNGFGSSLDPNTVYTVELLAGNTVLSSISGTGPEGTFAPFSLTFDSAGSLLEGQALQIRLSSSQAQSEFDDIRLDVVAPAAVPESPAFYVMALLFAAALIYRVRPAIATSFRR